MDLVDHALAGDMLAVMHDTIRRSSRHDLMQQYQTSQSLIMHMADWFFFSKVNRGILILNDTKLGFRDDQFMCLMFQIHSE